MGWRERDYAKFRKDEFNALYGQGGPNDPYGTATVPVARSTSPRRRRRRRGVPRGLRLVVLAVVAAAALFGGAIVTGRVEDIDSLFQRTLSPSPAVMIQPAPVQVQRPASRWSTRIAGTRLLQYGSTFRVSGAHAPMAGMIVISGRWGSGPWETFAVARGASRSFAFGVPLTRRGVLHVRIAYPDGERAVGTYQVR